MASSGSTYIPWNKVREPVPQRIQVPMCKLMESNYYGMRFFMCDNYEYDPPRRNGKDKPKVIHLTT